MHFKLTKFIFLVYCFLFSVVTVNAKTILLDAVEFWPPNSIASDHDNSFISDNKSKSNDCEKKDGAIIQVNYKLGDVDSGYDIEFSVPISSTFSLSVRGAYFTRKVEGYGSYRDWYWDYSYYWGYYRRYYTYSYSYSDTHTYKDCSTLIIWEPLKENLFSPYIAAGGRYSHFDSDYDSDSDIEEFGYVALAGLRLNLGFLTLRGEYSFGSYGESEATEILGDVGISVTDSMQLHVNYKIFDSDDADDSISMYGGGISFGF